MRIVFSQYPEAVATTMGIAERVKVSLETKEHHLPKFPVPKNYDSASYFEHVTREGLKQRLAVPRKHEPQGYWDRLAREIEVIAKTGFAGYFLVVWDFNKYEKDHAISVCRG